MKFVDLGTRNKGTFWEYASAWTFSQTKLPGTAYTIPSFLSFAQGEPNAHCHEVAVLVATKKIQLAELSNGAYTEKFFTNLAKIYLTQYKSIKTILACDPINVSNKSLADYLEKIVFAFASTHTPMLFALKAHYLDKEYSVELMNVLQRDKKSNLLNYESLKAMLLTNPKMSFAQEEENYISEIMILYAKNHSHLSFFKFIDSPSIKKKIKKLANDFGWFHREYMAKPFTPQDYRNIILERNESKAMPINMVKQLCEIEAQQKDFLKSHPSAELSNFITFMHGCAYILDHSKVIAIKIIHESEHIFNEVSQRIGVSRIDMLYLTLPEVVKLLIDGKKADNGLIAERKVSRAVILLNGEIKVYEGEAARIIGSKYIEDVQSPSNTFVKGVVAVPGNVRGKVCVISSINQKDKFTKGDILITKDGPAELTYFLKKASAIVTDQGGIISHVAIVARELNTPCVVATKFATKVFKDDDLVEMTPDGIVRKIDTK